LPDSLLDYLVAVVRAHASTGCRGSSPACPASNGQLTCGQRVLLLLLLLLL